MITESAAVVEGPKRVGGNYRRVPSARQWVGLKSCFAPIVAIAASGERDSKQPSAT
jgi:hypothetical protein